MKILFYYKNGELIDVIRIMINKGRIVAVKDINGIIELCDEFDMIIEE